MSTLNKAILAFNKNSKKKLKLVPVRKPAKALDFKVKYKTEVCRNWEHGKCKFGDACAFAHGDHELRNKQHLSKRYKQQQCFHFFNFSFCNYGPRCQYSHEDTAESSRTRLPVFVNLTQDVSN